MTDRKSEVASTKVKRKRPRAILACERCRLKKYKCTESFPCLHCKRSGTECTYARSHALQREPGLVSPPSDLQPSYVRQLEDRVEELEGLLGGHRDRVNRPQTGSKIQADASPRTSRHQSVSETGQSPSESEIIAVNHHTNSVEFHGSTSSMSFLGSLQKLQGQEEVRSQPSPSQSLVSDLHNPAFAQPLPQAADTGTSWHCNELYYRRAHTFMDAYFTGIHFIHPIIDKEDFVSRAHEMWLDRARETSTTFMALYLSLLSFGALTRTWEEDELDGMGRLQWSRRLFTEAQSYLNGHQFSNDLEVVQSLYLMAKICQNELNPNLAYMYLGLAVRTCLSAGFNRETSNPKTKHAEALSKTWWGIYSLEIEMSFLLGRPDTLGLDIYHNRALPPVDDSQFAIIPLMAKFGRDIVRKVSADIYHSSVPLPDNVDTAFRIDKELDAWLAGLPHWSGTASDGVRKPRALSEPEWRRRQRLVLEIRYHNVKMLLFRPFLSFCLRNQPQPAQSFDEATSKCVLSAKRTIEIIYETFMVHAYFRTWFFNVTYVAMAASILLMHSLRTQGSTDDTLNFVEMAVELLDVMGESVVARKSSELIRRVLGQLWRSRERAAACDEQSTASTAPGFDQPSVEQPAPVDFSEFDFSDCSLEGMSYLFSGFVEPLEGLREADFGGINPSANL